MNGKPGDNPLTDMLYYGRHPFPPDIEEMLRALHNGRPEFLRTETSPIGFGEIIDWSEGRNLEAGRVKLRALLEA